MNQPESTKPTPRLPAGTHSPDCDFLDQHPGMTLNKPCNCGAVKKT